MSNKLVFRKHALQRMFQRSISTEPESETIVITVYEPDPALWEPGFERKKP